MELLQFDVQVRRRRVARFAVCFSFLRVTVMGEVVAGPHDASAVAASDPAQMSPPQWRDESKALRARVLESTGKTVEEGGLEMLLNTPGAAEQLHSLLGCDAQVLAAELVRTAWTERG